MSTVLEKCGSDSLPVVIEVKNDKVTKHDLKAQENWAIEQFQRVNSDLSKNKNHLKVLEHEHALMKENAKTQRDVDRIQNERLTRVVRWLGFLIFWNLMGLAFTICLVAAYLFIN